MFKKIKSLFAEEKQEPFQQPEDAGELVANRRMKRRLKAALSVSLALGAGAFLSCQRFLGLDGDEQTPPKSEPATQEAKSQASQPTSSQSAPSMPSTQPESASVPTTSALTTTTQPTKEPKHKSKSSTNKHRKGMPVLDNLLE